MSMLHMLWGCFSGNRSQKRMFLKVHVIYIQEASSVFNQSESVEAERTKLITDLCKQYQFTYTVVPIDYVFKLTSESHHVPKSEEEYNKFHD